MTIIEAINIADNLKFNTYTQTDKVGWLSKLEWMIKRHIIDTHEFSDETEFDGYDSETDLETQLLAEAPYDAMYPAWISAQIDLHNSEIDKYNVSILQFNTEYEAFENYINRTHMPKQAGRRLLF